MPPPTTTQSARWRVQRVDDLVLGLGIVGSDEAVRGFVAGVAELRLPHRDRHLHDLGVDARYRVGIEADEQHLVGGHPARYPRDAAGYTGNNLESDHRGERSTGRGPGEEA